MSDCCYCTSNMGVEGNSGPVWLLRVSNHPSMLQKLVSVVGIDAAARSSCR